MADSDARLIWELYAAALRHEPAERGEYLERACSDPALRARVASCSNRTASNLAQTRTTTQSPREEVSLAGRQIGNYLIERELGRGGMGVVYLAHDFGWRARWRSRRSARPTASHRQCVSGFSMKPRWPPRCRIRASPRFMRSKRSTASCTWPASTCPARLFARLSNRVRCRSST